MGAPEPAPQLRARARAAAAARAHAARAGSTAFAGRAGERGAPRSVGRSGPQAGGWAGGPRALAAKMAAPARRRPHVRAAPPASLAAAAAAERSGTSSTNADGSKSTSPGSALAEADELALLHSSSDEAGLLDARAPLPRRVPRRYAAAAATAKATNRSEGDAGSPGTPPADTELSTPPRFAFEARVARIDWRALARVDVDAIISDTDVGTLEAAVENVAFGDLEAVRTRACSHGRARARTGTRARARTPTHARRESRARTLARLHAC